MMMMMITTTTKAVTILIIQLVTLRAGSAAQLPITRPERVITDKKMNEFVSEYPHNIPSGIRRMLCTSRLSKHKKLEWQKAALIHETDKKMKNTAE